MDKWFAGILIYLIFFVLISINSYFFSILNSKFEVRGYKMLIPNVIEGLINGAIVVLVQLIGQYSFHLNVLYISLTLFIFIIIRNWTVFLSSLIVPLISYSITNGSFTDPYVIILFLTISLLMLIMILKKVYFKKILMDTYLIPINILSIFIGIIISKFLWDISVSISNIMPYFYPLLFMVVFLIIYKILLSFWVSANSLIDINLYDFNNFYRIKSSEKALGSFLKNNKIKNGLFLMFSFYKDDQEVQNKEIILNNIEEHFAKFNAMFFKISKNEYGIFFSLLKMPNISISIFGNSLKRRTRKDFLYEVENSIKEFNKKVGIDFSFGCAIYGLQVFGYNEAYDMAKFTLDSSKVTGENIISLFNPIYYNKYKSDLLLIKKLNKEFFVSHIYTRFQICINSKGDIGKLYYSIPYISSSMNISAQEIFSYSKILGTNKILTRYLAAQTVKMFGDAKLDKESKVIFRYSPSIIANNNFNPFVFINIIKFHNVNMENIIMRFNFNDIVKYHNEFLFWHNINILKNNNIKIAVANIDLNSKTKTLLKTIAPNYIDIKPSFYNKKDNNNVLNRIIKLATSLNSKIIINKISNRNEWKNIIIHNIDILCGDYIKKPMIEARELTTQEKLEIKRRINV